MATYDPFRDLDRLASTLLDARLARHAVIAGPVGMGGGTAGPGIVGPLAIGTPVAQTRLSPFGRRLPAPCQRRR